MKRVSLDLLDAFAHMARHGNLTRAAEALHVTVSALSHRLRQLEDRIGERLFVRGSRGVTLTVAGRRLYEGVQTPLADIEEAVRRFDCQCGALTLSMPPLMTSGWLVPRLPGFVGRYPQVRLNLQSSAALVDFQRDAVDAAMRLGRGTWPGVHSEWLFDEWVRPVASPALIKAHGGLPVSRLGKAPLLADPADLWGAWFERFGGGDGPRRIVAGFTNSEALHEAAVQGLGVALGRDTLARPLIGAGRLVALSRRCMPAGYSHYLVYPPRSLAHDGFLAFRLWLYDTLEREAPELPAADAVPG